MIFKTGILAYVLIITETTVCKAQRISWWKYSCFCLNILRSIERECYKQKKRNFLLDFIF